MYYLMFLLMLYHFAQFTLAFSLPQADTSSQIMPSFYLVLEVISLTFYLFSTMWINIAYITILISSIEGLILLFYML